MKKYASIFLIIFLLTCVVWAIEGMYTYDKKGSMVDPGQLHSAQQAWVVVDSTTSDGTEPTALAADERTYTAVVAAIAAASSGDDEISIYAIPSRANSARFRCMGITNEGTITYQIYLGTLGPGGTNCELVNAGQLAFVIGQQVSTMSGYEMADTLTITEYCWSSAWTAKSPTNGLVAEGRVDLQGADVMIIVATTVTCDAKLLVKGY